MDKFALAIVGPGRVGTTVALCAHKHGYKVSAIAGRKAEDVERAAKLTNAEVRSFSEAPSGADVVFLTVADDAIEAVCAEMAASKSFSEGQIVAHCSGALTSEVLRSARDRCGAKIASAQPVQSFSTYNSAVDAMPGTYWFCEGNEDAVEKLTRFISDIGGIPNKISAENKVFCHSAACISSNYLVGVIDGALRAAELAGMERDLAWRALAPIVRKTVDNIDKLGTVGALTGPIARGDVNTVQRHVDALDKGDESLAKTYRAMGIWTVGISVRKGLKDDVAREIVRRLEE